MALTDSVLTKPSPAFWKISGAGATFQAGSTAVDSATVVASLVYHLTGSVYAVGAASAVLRLGWLTSQLGVGYLAQRAERRMPYYCVGAFGRAACIAIIALLLLTADQWSEQSVAIGFLIMWTIYAFVSGIVAVPYNDIVGRSIPSEQRSRMLAWRFFGGGVLALGAAALADRLLANGPVLSAYGWIFALASALMIVSSVSFTAAGEPPVIRTTSAADDQQTFKQFLLGGRAVWNSDPRFRLFLCSQWLAGATLMALPFYIVAATNIGLTVQHVGLLLGAQTIGSLASNPLWGRVGDQYGKLTLLQTVGYLRVATPLLALTILSLYGSGVTITLVPFVILFAFVGALSNGMTIGFLGYLMEISPDTQRPAYSAYFNAMASPAALLPLLGAFLADTVSLHMVFGMTMIASLAQLLIYRRLKALTEVEAT